VPYISSRAVSGEELQVNSYKTTDKKKLVSKSRSGNEGTTSFLSELVKKIVA
jgi:hypothetical protein